MATTPDLSFESGQAGKLKDVLEQGLAEDFDQPANIDDYILESPFAAEALVFRDKALADLEGVQETVLSLAEGAAFDTDALVQRLDDTFALTKNKMMNSALASTQKAVFELDSYLGRGGGDSRAVVRRSMANGITSGLLNSTQQNVAALYSGHVDKVVDTTLRGAELNAGIKMDAAKTLADLAGKGADLILGTNAALVNSYSQAMNTGIELIKAKSAMLSTIYGVEETAYTTRAKLLTDPLYARGTAFTAFKASDLVGTTHTGATRRAMEKNANRLREAGYGSF